MLIYFQNLLTLRSFSHLAGEVECHHSQVVYISSSEVSIEHSVDKWIEAAISKYQFYDYIFNQCRSWTLIMLLPVYHSLRGKMYKNRKVLKLPDRFNCFTCNMKQICSHWELCPLSTSVHNSCYLSKLSQWDLIWMVLTSLGRPSPTYNISIKLYIKHYFTNRTA